MTKTTSEPNLDNLRQIGNYLNILATQKKLATLTVSAYRRDLTDLQNLAGPTSLSELTDSHMRRYAAKMHGAGLSPRSIARTLSAWRGFYDWLLEQGLIKTNPLLVIKAPKRGKPLPKALNVDDAVALVSNKPSPVDKTTQACNTAMFELLYSSGLRVSELVDLDIYYVASPEYTSRAWFDSASKEVTVIGKGSKQRTIPVGSHALGAIEAWLDVRKKLESSPLENNKAALFITSRGTRMSSRLVQLRIKAHAQALGIQADVHPHMMRHSFASHLLQGSGDLRAVQELLGHASIASTQVYTALDFQHLAKVYDNAHPRAKKKS